MSVVDDGERFRRATVTPLCEVYLAMLATQLRLDPADMRQAAMGLTVDWAADLWRLGEQSAYDRPTVETPVIERE